MRTNRFPSFDHRAPRLFPGSAVAFFTTRRTPVETEALAPLLGVGADRVFRPVQRHTDRVLRYAPGDRPEVADAVITDAAGVFIGVITADCVPILLHDPVSRSIGAVHAGWRGTAARILVRTIEEMGRAFGARPFDLHVAVGPSIRGCCYNVGPDVADAVRRASGEAGGRLVALREGRLHLDLAEANRLQAVGCGVEAGRIEVLEGCTACRPGSFHSYRRDGKEAGRQGAFIRLERQRGIHG